MSGAHQPSRQRPPGPPPESDGQVLLPGGTGLFDDTAILAVPPAIVTIVTPPKKRRGRPPVMTKEVRARYLEELRAGRRPGIAAGNVGVSKSSVERYVKAHPKYAEKVRAAIAGAVEHLEDAAWKSATEDRNPTMLIFMLANLASDRFRRDPDKALLAQINVGGQSVEWTLQDARARLHGMVDELEAQRQKNAQAIEAESREADSG